MSLLAFWCASICSLPFGWLVFFSLALKWLRARCGWGDPGVAWSRVLAKFYLQCAKFYAASTFHFHFSYSSCCHHPALLPDHGMPPWDLLPPSAAPLRRRPLGILSISSRFPPKSAPSLEQIVSHSIVGKSILTNILSFLVYSISDSFYSIFPSWQSSL